MLSFRIWKRLPIRKLKEYPYYLLFSYILSVFLYSVFGVDSSEYCVLYKYIVPNAKTK